MTESVASAGGALKDEYAFYIAHAYVIAPTSATCCKLWLLDHTNDSKVASWLDGKFTIVDFEAEMVEVNLDCTLDQADDDYLVHVAPPDFNGFVLTQLSGDQPLGETQGQVAIEERIWQQIPDEDRPLPPRPWRDQDYRLKVILQVDKIGAVADGFMGFHAKILDAEDAAHPGQWRVQFYSWTNEKLDVAWIDLDDPVYHQQYTTIQRIPDAEGPIFVSMAAIGEPPLSQLAGPKVPFGAGQASSTTSNQPARPRAASLVGRANRGSVICNSSDDSWSRAVRRRIANPGEATDKATLQKLINAILASSASDSIELISHSIQNSPHRNILRFDNFALTAEELVNLGITSPSGNRRTIYLIGCRTALGKEAQDVLARFEDKFGIKAYGTRRIVGLYDLDQHGVKMTRRSKLFADAAAHLPPKEAIDEFEIAAAGGVRRPFPRDELRELLLEMSPAEKRIAAATISVVDDIVNRVARLEWFELPGLLAVPSRLHQRLYSESLSVDSFLDQQLLRFTFGSSSTRVARAHAARRGRTRPLELISTSSPENTQKLLQLFNIIL